MLENIDWGAGRDYTVIAMINYDYSLASVRRLSQKHNLTPEENLIRVQVERPKTQAELLGWHVTPTAEYLLKKLNRWI